MRIMGFTLKEERVLAKMAAYTLEKYHMQLDLVSADCPYVFDNEEIDIFVAHVWAAHKALVPGKKIRMIDEFAQKYVDDPAIAASIRRATHIICGEFYVAKQYRKDRAFLLRSLRDGAEYRAKGGPNVMARLSVGMRATCLLSPWEEDGTHRIGSVLGERCKFVDDRDGGGSGPRKEDHVYKLHRGTAGR